MVPTGHYDKIILGYVDSHSLFSAMSSVRLDNFVYTAEAFREFKQHLLRLAGRSLSLLLFMSSGLRIDYTHCFARLSAPHHWFFKELAAPLAARYFLPAKGFKHFARNT